MPKTARILPFHPRDKAVGLSNEDALRLAKHYLQAPAEEQDSFEEQLLDSTEAALALLSLFNELIEVSPSAVAHHAARLHERLRCATNPLGLFDEKDYILGEYARFAGSACRGLGRYDEAERWLDRAEASYRHTVNPAPLLSTVAYAKLAIRYETHRHVDVLDLTPSLIESFKKLGMHSEGAKAEYLRALSLRASGRGAEAFEAYSGLLKTLKASGEGSLLGQVLVQMGDYRGSLGQFDESLTYYCEALSILEKFGRPAALAELKWSIGASYRAQGNLNVALEAYRKAKADYRSLGMSVFESFVALAIADTLLSLQRPREAEWEIQSALPAIEKAELGPETIAAANLLRESVRQRKTDPKALRELGEMLASRH